MDRWNFYKKNFLKNINNEAKILVISASLNEIKILKEMGYNNINITYHNDDDIEILKQQGFKVYKNLFKADVRNLDFENKSFDYVITNATLHHVDLPHKAVTEMYRIAKKGVLIIESNDSFLMQAACKLNFAEEFEISSVNPKIKSGGLLDTGIPNYVYRWNEREIIKLLNSYDPEVINHIKFEYDYDLSSIRSDKYVNRVLKFIVKIFFYFFKKQQNCLSIFIDLSKIKKREFSKF